MRLAISATIGFVAIGIWYFRKSLFGSSVIYSESLVGALKTKNMVKGNPRPVESTLLVPVVVDEYGVKYQLVMSISQRIDKGQEKKELALVGGKTESMFSTDAKMLDYADSRFIKNGKQISEEECKQIIFENPKLSLAREVLEEITGNKNVDISYYKHLDWFVSKIINSTADNWTVVTTNKQVKLSDDSKIKFQTDMALCSILLTQEEVDKLNIDISKYSGREHIEFVLKDFKITEEVKDEKVKRALTVTTDDLPVRGYNELMFGFYPNEFYQLIHRQKPCVIKLN